MLQERIRKEKNPEVRERLERVLQKMVMYYNHELLCDIFLYILS